ncbi:MAG TPA: hypothetical protein VG738_01520 [Chitinophagaceae bacterium]|nr:hypothetical protein [Chitinophagaceae bacterium]
MNKRIAVIIAAVLVIAVTVCYFVNIDTEERVSVHASLLNTVHELATPTEWQKWHPVLHGHPTNDGSITVDSAAKSFTLRAGVRKVKVINHGLTFIVADTANSHSSLYSYNALPTLLDDSTIILIVRQKKLLQALLPFLSNDRDEVTAVDSLKSFMETPAKFYGFDIERRNVVDTNVAMTTRTVNPANRFTAIDDMQKKLETYITVNHLAVMQPPIVHYQPLSKDSLEIMMAIPVNRTAAPQNSIVSKRMPDGFMLVGYYKGNFEGRKALYKAMDRFVRDRGLHIIAINYEKYIDNTLPKNDSSAVELEVYYPIL